MLKLEKVSKIFSLQTDQGATHVAALKGVSLEITQGEFVAIMGSSGSGKSTLLNIIGLLDVPTAGSYLIQGRETQNLNEDELAYLRLKTIGFVFQQFNLLAKLTAMENICMPLIYAAAEERDKEFSQYAQELIQKTGMKGREHHLPSELSGGQQQRVAISRALINRPLMILADEPTGNLDSQSEQDILKVFKDLNEQGITVVIVTHDESVANVADRVVRMKDGEIIGDQRQPKKSELEIKAAPTAISTDATSSIDKASEKKQEYFLFLLMILKQGMITLQRGRFRTLLSMLGILIGVASVIAMLALGRGAQKSIEAEFSTLGAKLLVVKPVTIKADTPDSHGVLPRLDLEDGNFLKQEIPSILKVAPIISKALPIASGSKSWTSMVFGVGPQYEFIRHSTPTYGRFFTEVENAQRARVALIGRTVYRNYFKGTNPVGDMIKIDKVLFQVIGILPRRGSDGEVDRDNSILIPVQTAMHRLIGRDYVDAYDVEISDEKKSSLIEKKIPEILSSKHHLFGSAEHAFFEVRNMALVLKAMNKTNETMFFLLAIIALISLIVGGIGIMNVMLVSIAERTKEIGLRKSVGARKQDILVQFLIEAILITTVGGVAGILLGVISSFVISQFFSWPTSVSFFSLCLSFSFSVLVGIIFGYMPAKKASEKHPIEALKGI